MRFWSITASSPVGNAFAVCSRITLHGRLDRDFESKPLQRSNRTLARPEGPVLLPNGREGGFDQQGTEPSVPLRVVPALCPDDLIEIVEMRQDLPDEKRMMGPERPVSAVRSAVELRAQLALREIGQHDRVRRAAHRRREHRSPRLPKDVARDGGELDSGVLEHLVQPIRFPLPLVV